MQLCTSSNSKVMIQRDYPKCTQGKKCGILLSLQQTQILLLVIWRLMLHTDSNKNQANCRTLWDLLLIPGQVVKAQPHHQTGPFLFLQLENRIFWNKEIILKKFAVKSTFIIYIHLSISYPVPHSRHRLVVADPSPQSIQCDLHDWQKLENYMYMS